MTTIEILLAIFLPAITLLVGIIGWFLKDKLNGLINTDKRLEGKVDKIGEKVEETRGAVIEMQNTFNRLGYPMQRILKTTSPLTLTEYGKKLIEESGFNQIFNENRSLILGWIKEKNPKTQYDVQENSRDILLGHKDDVVFAPLKEYAYKHGETSLEQIFRAGSIVVRDEIIKELNLAK